MWIASQAVGGVSLIWWFLTYQQKSKEKTLWMSSIGKFFGIITNVLLFNWIMAGLLLVRVPRDSTFAYIERRRKKGRPIAFRISLILFLLFCILTLANTLIIHFTHEQFWFNWILLIGAIFVNFGKWKKGLKIFWISVIIWSILAIINALIFNNFTTIITCTIVLISVFIAIARHVKKLRSFPTLDKFKYDKDDREGLTYISNMVKFHYKKMKIERLAI